MLYVLCAGLCASFHFSFVVLSEVDTCSPPRFVSPLHRSCLVTNSTDYSYGQSSTLRSIRNWYAHYIYFFTNDSTLPNVSLMASCFADVTTHASGSLSSSLDHLLNTTGLAIYPCLHMSVYICHVSACRHCWRVQMDRFFPDAGLTHRTQAKSH